MKTSLRKFLSMFLCVSLLMGMLAVSGMVVSAENQSEVVIESLILGKYSTRQQS